MGPEKKELFRLPWSMNDNPIGWLEVTDICDLHCKGCYRQRLSGHKPLEQVKHEILFLKKWRNPDNISIAGGEPMVYPHILETVEFISQNGMKPILLTNAMKLNKGKLRELKKAGLAGFTIHIDSSQKRPKWVDRSEAELNQLRQFYADMIAEVGCGCAIFNATVCPSNFWQIPDVVKWANRNVDKVHGLVFITYRGVSTGNGVDYILGDDHVEVEALSYVTEAADEINVTSADIYNLLKENFPAYEAAAYLGGTSLHDSLKWLIGVLVASKKKVYGSLGARTVELAQVFHHLFHGTYIAYNSKSKMGKSILLFSPRDKTLGKARSDFKKTVLRNPLRFFDTIRLQSIAIIQAPDLLPDGRVDMCDSCPDMTFYKGMLVNSCRMDEYRKFGGLMSMVPGARMWKREPVTSQQK